MLCCCVKKGADDGDTGPQDSAHGSAQPQSTTRPRDQTGERVRDGSDTPPSSRPVLRPPPEAEALESRLRQPARPPALVQDESRGDELREVEDDPLPTERATAPGERAEHGGRGEQDVEDPAERDTDEVEARPSPFLDAPVPARSTRAPVVVRRDLREMSGPDQERFCDALALMMENGEYFRIAGLHGWPGQYCAHSQEVFPGWHRAYTVEFEQALQAADRDLGKDGDIGLPYWDSSRTFINGEVFPAILRRRFPDLPAPIAAQIAAHEAAAGAELLLRRGYRMSSDEVLAAGIEGVARRFELCLLEEEHWRHASTRWGRGTSLEDPHNLGHVALGFPMSSVSFAAFHPIFFLHHCHVDRVYERYLIVEPDSLDEFAAMQARLSRQRGEPNRFERALEPFRHPRTAEPFMPSHTFDAEALGFRYDLLPPEPPQASQMREAPTLCVFPNITKELVHFQSYHVHVFVPPKTARLRDEVPPLAHEITEWVKAPCYAGSCAIFGGKGADCANCLDVQPFAVIVDVGEALRRQGLARSEAMIVTYLIDEAGEHRMLSGTGVPAPRLMGAYFEDPEADLGEGLGGPDVEAARRRLDKLGYNTADDEPGVLGPGTREALMAFQRRNGLDPVGRLNAETKAMLVRRRFDELADSLADGLDGQDASPTLPSGELLAAGATVPYSVGVVPGYLSRRAVLREVKEALDMWSEVTGVVFSRADAPDGAVLELLWDDHTDSNDFIFDGPGGTLAKTDGWTVTFDSAERWALRGREQSPNAFALFPVLLHEIGHVLGLAHAPGHADEVMSPYYEPDREALTPGDIERAHALYAL